MTPMDATPAVESHFILTPMDNDT